MVKDSAHTYFFLLSGQSGYKRKIKVLAEERNEKNCWHRKKIKKKSKSNVDSNILRWNKKLI